MGNWCSFTIYHNMAPSTIVGFSGTNICLPTIPTSLSRYRYSSYETRLLLTFEVRTLCGLIVLCQAMATTAGLEPTTTESKSVVLPLHYVVIFSYFPLYFHLNFARGTVTIWINYFYRDKVTTLWIRIFITTDRFPLIKTVLVTVSGFEPEILGLKGRCVKPIPPYRHIIHLSL